MGNLLSKIQEYADDDKEKEAKPSANSPQSSGFARPHTTTAG
jgi:hypothetical protein